MGVIVVSAIIILSGYSHDIMVDGGSIKLGQSCKRDYQCIKNAYCRSQATCWCDTTYTPDPNMSICHAAAGTSCNNNEDCITMSNAECIQDTCVCMSNFFLDINNSSNCIIRPTKTGDKCQQNGECIQNLGRAHCEYEKCKCNSDYKFANETRKCIRARTIYQSCTHDYECYDQVEQNSLHCTNGECVYRDRGTSNRRTAMSNYLLILELNCILFSRLW